MVTLASVMITEHLIPAILRGQCHHPKITEVESQSVALEMDRAQCSNF